MDKQRIIQNTLRGWLVPGKEYHSSLPPELASWYCYTSDGGHSIVSVLKQHYQADTDNEGNLVPIPVKAVLRGYEIKNGYVVVDLPYSSEIGLITNAGDDEF